MARPFRTPVRGHAFAARGPDASEPVPGQLARLIREPGNPADRYAVGVWVAGRAGRWRIGYLDRLVAARLAPRLDAGVRIAARVDGWTPEPDGRWRRPLLVVHPDGTAPASLTGTAPASRTGTGPAAIAGTDSGPIDAARAVPAPAEVDARATLWGRPPGMTRRVLRHR